MATTTTSKSKQNREKATDPIAAAEKHLSQAADAMKKAREALKQKVNDAQVVVDELEQELEQLDEKANTMGIEIGQEKRRRGRRGGHSGKTAKQVITEFIQGCKTAPTTSEINHHYAKQGFSGRPDPILNTLQKEGVVKRVKEEGVRGSKYELIDA